VKMVLIIQDGDGVLSMIELIKGLRCNPDLANRLQLPSILHQVLPLSAEGFHTCQRSIVPPSARHSERRACGPPRRSTNQGSRFLERSMTCRPPRKPVVLVLRSGSTTSTAKAASAARTRRAPEFPACWTMHPVPTVSLGAGSAAAACTDPCLPSSLASTKSASSRTATPRRQEATTRRWARQARAPPSRGQPSAPCSGPCHLSCSAFTATTLDKRAGGWSGRHQHATWQVAAGTPALVAAATAGGLSSSTSRPERMMTQGRRRPAGRRARRCRAMSASGGAHGCSTRSGSRL